MYSHRLTLTEAIFININIMIGVGIFVNTTQLARLAGILSPLSYFFIAILLFPLILSVVRLLSYYPEGGFYHYASKELSVFGGFAAAWAYFIGKLASATLVLYTCVFLFCELVPGLKIIHLWQLYIIFLFIILSVNAVGIRVGSIIQRTIVYAKFVPIVLMIGIGIYRFFFFEFTLVLPSIGNFIETMPMVLHATSGFETACVLSLAIQNPEKNAPRAVFASYFIVICMAIVYQFFSTVALGAHLEFVKTYNEAFLMVSRALPVSLSELGKFLLYGGVACSAFGSAFGMFYSSIWNFFTLVNHDHIPGSMYLKKMNRYSIPFYIIAIEGLVSIFLLRVTNGNILLLQQCSALAISLTFFLSIISLLKIYLRERRSIVLPLLALCNCMLFVVVCLYSLMKTSMYAFVLFACLFSFGIVMFLLANRMRMRK